MHVELECEGEVRLGPLGRETAERLGSFAGEWLEYAADRNALVVRHVQPGGSPALAAVPAELITILDSIPPAEREAIAGGTFFIRSRNVRILRLVVDRNGLRIEWPHQDWQQAVPVDVERALATADPLAARVSGRAVFRTKPEKAGVLSDFVDRFEGLYPEGDLDTAFDGTTVTAEFRDVNVGPAQLRAKLRELADPIDSLEAELDIDSFAPHSADRTFRLSLRGNDAKAVRPLVWRQE